MIFDRFTNDETITVAINMSDLETEVDIAGTLLLSSDPARMRHRLDGRLAPYEAVVVSAD